MNSLESVAGIILAGCVSGAVVFILTWTVDFVAPVRSMLLERQQCEQARGKAVMIGVLTGIGIHLARHFSG